jgi:hypothetical protein
VADRECTKGLLADLSVHTQKEQVLSQPKSRK